MDELGTVAEAAAGGGGGCLLRSLSRDCSMLKSLAKTAEVISESVAESPSTLRS